MLCVGVRRGWGGGEEGVGNRVEESLVMQVMQTFRQNHCKYQIYDSYIHTHRYFTVLDDL